MSDETLDSGQVCLSAVYTKVDFVTFLTFRHANFYRAAWNADAVLR